jgi:hypothetical protein
MPWLRRALIAACRAGYIPARKVGVELDHRDLTRAYPDPESALAVRITGLVAISD